MKNTGAKNTDRLTDAADDSKGDPYPWFEHGNFLLKSAELVYFTELSFFMKEAPPDISAFTSIGVAAMQRRDSRMLCYRLLLSSALECFLKASAATNSLETHNLVGLAEKQGLTISAMEHAFLTEMSMFSVVGRYPFLSRKQFARINTGEKPRTPMWQLIDNKATKSSGKFVTTYFVQFGDIGKEMAEQELGIARSLRDKVATHIKYTHRPTGRNESSG